MPSVVSPGLSVAPIAGLDGYAGEVQGGAYISWLQSALQQQSGVLNEREQSIKHLEDRLREATQMLALGRKSDADIDPEGFLIERIVDEEEKCAKLTAKVQEQAREILEKDGGMASMEDELRSLQAQLRELREERREDMVRTHSDWADAHLIYSPHSLPLEAVGTLVSDLQSRRADVLHLAQRLEDWNAALTVHYYKALQQQQRLPKRGQSGIASFTAEIKKISDSLFHRLRGECLQLTHDELSVLSQGHLSRCRADTTTFLQAFRRFKNIIRSVGMPVTDPNSTCWLQNEIRIEAMLSRMDTSARAQLIESAREMVLCYDTNPRTIQSSHGKLLEELSMNLKTVVAALRIAASPVNISVTGTQRVFPVNLSDARLVDRDGRAPNTSKRRPNSAGPRPSSRATTTTPTAASHRAGSRDSVTSRASSQSSQPNLKAGRLSTPRSISPYVRTTNAPPSSSPATTLPSPRVSAVRGRVASPGWVQRYKPDPGDPSPVPNGKLLVSTTPPAARNGYGAGGCPPPPDIEPAAARSNQASLNAGAAIPLRLPGKPQPPPPPQRANGSPAPAVIITNSTTTAALTSARAVFSDNHTPVRPYGRAGAATTPSAATPTAPQVWPLSFAFFLELTFA
ncbi:hypothetical protein DIPPA_27778 [Diplonema papillatum]|nr:hypothetical protein DIPPA_27778 [Diplonema papillatum]